MSKPLALAALLLALPRLALAEPALIRLFEAPARAAPSREAPVVHVFAEGQQVSVSEAGEGAFRKVRLPDGGVGFIEEGALALPPPAAAPATTAPAPPGEAVPPPPAALPPPLDLRARLYVKDLDHLSALVKDDPVVAPMAEALAARQRAAWAIGLVGVVGGTALSIAGASQMSRDMGTPGDPATTSSSNGQGLLVAGIVVMSAGLVGALVASPREGDLIDLLNAWNPRHPDRQLELERYYAGHGRVGADLSVR